MYIDEIIIRHSTLTNGTAGFPDDVFRNGCANQNKVNFVVFRRLFVRRG